MKTKSDNQEEPSPNNGKELMDKLKKMSLEEKISKQGNSNKNSSSILLASQYQLNYRPMPIGVRKDLWEEGYKYRALRRKNGLNHFKLDWMLPSDRSALGSGKYRRSIKRLANGEYAPLEPLNLPPTKIEKKRQKLKKIYEKTLLKERPKTSMDMIRLRANELTDEKDDNQVITSYERNRLNNIESHITLPTSFSLPSSNNSELESQSILENESMVDKKSINPKIIVENPITYNTIMSQEDDKKQCDSKEVQTETIRTLRGSPRKKLPQTKAWK